MFIITDVPKRLRWRVRVVPIIAAWHANDSEFSRELFNARPEFIVAYTVQIPTARPAVSTGYGDLTASFMALFLLAISHLYFVTSILRNSSCIA